MKNILALLAVTIFPVYMNAQQPWLAVGSGSNSLKVNGLINAMAIDATGDLYVAGDFTDTTFLYFRSYVAKWNGTTWAKVGTGENGIFNGSIKSLAADALGNVYAGGDFTEGVHQGDGSYYVAKWNGTSWTELGGANGLKANGSMWRIITDQSNNVYAAGSFTNSNNKNYVAKWNGTTWSEVGGGSGALNANNIIYAIAVDNAGNAYAGGPFTDSSVDKYGGAISVYKFNGTSWSRLGNPLKPSNNNPGSITSLAVDASGTPYLTGSGLNTPLFTNAGAMWNGSSWVFLNGSNVSIDQLLYKNGNLYGSGRTSYANGARATVFKWGGSNWQPALDTLANGTDMYSSINAFTVDGSGALYAAGPFIADANNKYYVARTNGGVFDVSGTSISSSPISLYPNPGTGLFTVKAIDPIKSIQVYNLTGTLVTQVKATSRIDLRAIPTGMYFAKVTTTTQIGSFRIIKQ